MTRQLGGFLLMLLVWAQSAAVAQTPVRTQPLNSASVNASSTVAVTNTFQQVFAPPTNQNGRLGCVIQNNGSNTMWVFNGPIASATKAASAVLHAGDVYKCAAGGIVINDQISITGTATDAFYANGQ